MTDKELLLQLKMLRGVQPSADWKNKQKRYLLSKTTEFEITPVENTPRHSYQVFSQILQSVTVLRRQMYAVPVAVFSLMLLISGGVTVHASLPGDSLYTIKRVAEEGRLLLALNPEQKLRLQMDLLEKRIDELKQVAARHSNNGDIHAPVKEIKDNIATLEQSIPLVFQRQQDKMQSIADYINQKSQGYESALGELEGTMQKNGTTSHSDSTFAVDAPKGFSGDATLEERFRAFSNSLETTKAKVTLLVQEISAQQDQIAEDPENAEEDISAPDTAPNEEPVVDVIEGEETVDIVVDEQDATITDAPVDTEAIVPVENQIESNPQE